MEMLPRLEAQRELAAIQTGHAYVDRAMEDRDQRHYVRGLRKRAGYEQQSGSLDSLASFGIQVVRSGGRG